MSAKSGTSLVLDLTSLPEDVMFLHVVPYLSPRDIGNMSKLNRYFRNMFNTAHPWMNVQICLASANFRKNKFSQLLETLKVRRIRNLKMVGRDFNFLCLKSILESLPSVERLSLPKTTNSIINVLLDFASKDQLHLKKITFGKLGRNSFREGGYPSSKGNLVGLFKLLSSLEDVCVGPFDWQYEELLLREIEQGLCSCPGGLKSITLANCRSLKMSSIKKILVGNPQLHTLRLMFIELFDWDCSLLPNGEELKDMKAKICPSLQVLSLKGSSLPYQVPSLQYNCNPRQITGITSLDLSLCSISDDLARVFKFPDLRKLNLTKAWVVADPFFHETLNLPHLEWLELNSSHWYKLEDTSMVHCIMESPIGSTLRHLGLADLENIKDSELKLLPIACPLLRSLDLSASNQVTDALLVEWYMKRNQVCLPKLRKLGLKACKKVTQQMVDSVRLKTGNQVLIDR